MLVDLGLEAEMFSEAASGGMQAPLFHFRDRGDRRADRGLRHQPAQGRSAVSLCRAVGAVQAGARRAAPYQGERPRRGAFLHQAHRPCADATITSRRRSPNAAGETETLRGKYLIGADGGSSTVRRLAEIAFEGFTWPERFIKIGTSFDFGSTGKGYCTRNYFSDPDEWINLFKVKGYGPPGIWRGVFPVPEKETDEAGAEHGRHPAPPAGHPSERAAITTFPITRSTPCISASPPPSTRAACCSPATAPMSTIRSAAWA